jgi:hypothetical protein
MFVGDGDERVGYRAGVWDFGGLRCRRRLRWEKDCEAGFGGLGWVVGRCIGMGAEDVASLGGVDVGCTK